MINDRRLPSGYYNLGPVQIPPRSEAVILTDRADGSFWLVSFNSNSPHRLSINTAYRTIQRREGIQVYAANEGPKFDEDGQFTLMVRGGRIGFDYAVFAGAEVAADSPPIYARQTRDERKLKISTTRVSTARIGIIE